MGGIDRFRQSGLKQPKLKNVGIKICRHWTLTGRAGVLRDSNFLDALASLKTMLVIK